MKPDTKIQNYQDSNIGTAHQMGLDANATAHLMDVLTKLYADPIMAIIREYSTNALDSHREAGNTKPIEVTLPTSTDPRLVIMDNGIGLDAEGIVNIYRNYGTSTKRDSNEAVGMLGLGCKSALAYGDQFTLTGTKDGTCTEVLVSKQENGVGQMAVVDEFASDAPDGLTVTIPIRPTDIDAVRTKAAEFFRFWTPGTVWVNGTPPNRIAVDDDQALWLDEHTLLTGHVSEDIVVMGNVPYPLYDGAEQLFTMPNNGVRRLNPATVRYEYGQALYTVVFVPIGTVNFVPSRESLMDTKRTKATLDKLRTKIAALRDKSVLEQIANAPTALEAQNLLTRGMAIGFDSQNTPATWRGQNVVLELERTPPLMTHPDGKPVLDANGATMLRGSYPVDWTAEEALARSFLHLSDNNYAKKAGERSLRYALGRNAIIFTGYTNKVMTNVKRAKLETWLTKNGHEVKHDYGGKTRTPYIVLVDKLSAHEKFWLNGHKIHDWAEVEAIELPKATAPDGTTKRVSGSYEGAVNGDLNRSIPAHEIAAYKGPVYWVRGNRFNATHSPPLRSGTIDAQTCMVIALGANRVDKFCRDFPAAKQLDDAAREAAERWMKKQDKDAVKAYSIQRSCDAATVKTLDPADLDDPDLREIHRLSKIDTQQQQVGRSKYERWLNGSPMTDPKAVAWANEVLEKYPLLGSQRHAVPKDHYTLYANAVYAQQKGV